MTPLAVMLSAAHPPDDLRVVRKEGAALAAAGWRVRHLCPAPRGEVPAVVAGVEIETYPRPGSRLRGLPALARRAAASGATVLHASEPDAWLAALLAARRSGARVVLDVHEHYPSRLDGRLPAGLRGVARAAIRAACGAMGRAADAVVVAKDGLDADFGVPDRVVAVRNYALPARVVPRRHEAGPVTLVHLGAIGRARGWPELLRAMALAGPAVRLCVIGRFTDGSEGAFREAVAAMGLGERVALLGWRPHEAALAEAARCDVGVVLFQPGTENHRLALPHKLFDCMLAGLPVIAPGFAEEVAAVVREAGCGILVDPSDPADIAAAVAALGDPVRRAVLGEAGRRAALGRFGWEAEAARLVALYERLAPRPRLAAPALAAY